MGSTDTPVTAANLISEGSSRITDFGDLRIQLLLETFGIVEPETRDQDSLVMVDKFPELQPRLVEFILTVDRHMTYVNAGISCGFHVQLPREQDEGWTFPEKSKHTRHVLRSPGAGSQYVLWHK